MKYDNYNFIFFQLFSKICLVRITLCSCIINQHWNYYLQQILQLDLKLIYYVKIIVLINIYIKSPNNRCKNYFLWMLNIPRKIKLILNYLYEALRLSRLRKLTITNRKNFNKFLLRNIQAINFFFFLNYFWKYMKRLKNKNSTLLFMQFNQCRFCFDHQLLICICNLKIYKITWWINCYETP